MLAGWKTLDTQNNSYDYRLIEKTTWTTIKEITGRRESWGRNKSLIGLISWQEEEEEEYILSNLNINYSEMLYL
jgi:hypothetical protein